SQRKPRPLPLVVPQPADPAREPKDEVNGNTEPSFPVHIEDEFKAFRILFICSISGFIVSVPAFCFGPDAPLFTLVFLLTPLLIWPALVYYKTRLIFFDVIIKRGSFVALLSLSSWLYFLHVLYPLQNYAGQRSRLAGLTILCLGAVAFAALCIRIRRPAYGALDRYLFRRPDYGELIPRILTEIRTFPDWFSLLQHITEELRTVLQADYVKFCAEPTFMSRTGPGEGRWVEQDVSAGVQRTAPAIAASAPVATSDRIYGRLLFGNRRHNQQYASEDLSFLTTIADQVAGMLSNFELSLARENQRRRERELRDSVAKSEIKELRAQINPDLLFQALSGIQHVLKSDPRAAEQAIINLSDIFRFRLESTRLDWTRVADELDLVRAYLDLRRVSGAGTLKVNYLIDSHGELADVRIALLLIQQAIECIVGDELNCINDRVDLVLGVRADQANILIHIEDRASIGSQNGFGPAENLFRKLGARIREVTGRDSLKVSWAADGARIIEFSAPRQPGLPDSDAVLNPEGRL
ncbi:MAG TPA: histidine kinase, partial [Blastocatellia bacterium]|nr:histidine kinase [Blastocatellia bacterium]